MVFNNPYSFFFFNDRLLTIQSWKQVPDIIDNAFVIIEFDNGCRGMLDLCMFAEGSKNEQEISVVGNTGKVNHHWHCTDVAAFLVCILCLATSTFPIGASLLMAIKLSVLSIIDVLYTISSCGYSFCYIFLCVENLRSFFQ